MQQFIKLIIIFSITVLSIFYAFDYIISTGLRNTDIRVFQSWNDIYASNINDDIVIVGSSRAWTQYSPKILDSILTLSTYNIGIDGHTIDYQILKYNTYRRFNQPPKFIIHNMDYGMGITENGYEREQFFPYIFDDSLINYVKEVKEISIFDRHVPLIRYWGYREYLESGFSAFGGDSIHFDGGLYKGYRGNTYTWDRTKLDSINDWKFSYNKEALKLLEEYLSHANNEKIQVIFVFAPYYFEAVNKMVNKDAAYKFYDSIAKKYNITTLDYTCDPIYLDSNNFYNATHLNKKGSELFSIKLAKDLDSIGVK